MEMVRIGQTVSSTMPDADATPHSMNSMLCFIALSTQLRLLIIGCIHM